MVSCKELRSVILQPWYKFCSRSPKVPISTGFKSGLFGDQWSGFSNRSYFLSFNISRVSLAVWAILHLGWINTHYVLSACSFQQSLSSIVHYNNTSHLPLYSVQQKKLKFYQLSISQQKRLHIFLIRNALFQLTSVSLNFFIN